MANFDAKRDLYRLSISAVTTAPVKTSVGYCIVPNYALADWRGPIDTLLVAGGHGYIAAFRDRALTDWLREAAPRARRHGSICTGAFPLAAAGLLDGKRATMHWNLASSFTQEFPSTRLEVDSILCETDRPTPRRAFQLEEARSGSLARFIARWRNPLVLMQPVPHSAAAIILAMDLVSFSGRFSWSGAKPPHCSKRKPVFRELAHTRSRFIRRTVSIALDNRTRANGAGLARHLSRTAHQHMGDIS